MRSYGITAGEISNALKTQNVEFPSRRLDQGTTETAVRTALTMARSVELRSQTDPNKAIADLQRDGKFFEGK